MKEILKKGRKSIKLKNKKARVIKWILKLRKLTNLYLC